MNRALFSLIVLAACNESVVVVGGLQEVTSMRAIPNRDLDLLFVIDDSPSMADKQVALAAAFPRMIDVLSQVDGGLPNLHIGVVTSDMGTSGTTGSPGPAVGVLGQGGCAGVGKDGALVQVGSMSDRYLSDVEGPSGARVTNYTGPLRDAFGQLAQVGAGGCGFEQHLSAMRRALANPLNAGFVRPSANLAVVILADEDDCSARTAALFGADPALGPLASFRCFRFGVECAQPTSEIGPKSACIPAHASAYVEDVSPFVDALLAAKPDARMVMTAAIAGDPTPVAVELRQHPGGGVAQPALAHSCEYTAPDASTEVADPGVRLAGFLDAFHGRNNLTSVCSADLANPLALIGASAKKLMGDPCLDSTRLADASAAEAGVQPSCEVADIRDSAPQAATLLPLCSSGSPDCFELVADAATCPATSDHLRVRIHRVAAVTQDTWTSIRCQLAH